MVKSASPVAGIEDGINAFANLRRGFSRFSTAHRIFTILEHISRPEGVLWHT